MMLNQWFLIGGDASPGGASTYAPYNIESLINICSNEYTRFCSLIKVSEGVRQGQLPKLLVVEKRIRTTVLNGNV